MSKTFLAQLNGREVTVSGDDDLTIYQAKKQAVAELQRGSRRKIKAYQVAIMLTEKDGEPVTHQPLF